MQDPTEALRTLPPWPPVSQVPARTNTAKTAILRTHRRTNWTDNITRNMPDVNGFHEDATILQHLSRLRCTPGAGRCGPQRRHSIRLSPCRTTGSGQEPALWLSRSRPRRQILKLAPSRLSARETILIKWEKAKSQRSGNKGGMPDSRTADEEYAGQIPLSPS